MNTNLNYPQLATIEERQPSVEHECQKAQKQEIQEVVEKSKQ